MANHAQDRGNFQLFDIGSFGEWCLTRWHVCALACISAAGLALGASLLQPNRYTATAVLMIGTPPGSDVRVATNSVYLDSLRAWEKVATSEGVLARASARTGGTVDRRAVRATKPAGVALLEISVTLPDAKQTQVLAQALAEETAAESHTADEKNNLELNGDFRDQFQAASARLQRAEAAREALTAVTPLEAFEAELGAAAGLSTKLAREIAMARAELAGYQGSLDPRQTEQAEARIASLVRQRKEATEVVSAKAARLQQLRSRRDVAEAEFRSARAALDLANTRLNEAVASVRYKGERLRVVDNGTVPERPSSPNIQLNVISALLVSVGASLAYLLLSFGLRRETSVSTEEPRGFSVL